MQLSSSYIPQADVIEDVVQVARAIRDGAKTYQDIAGYLGKVERQGRYYRRAAEIIGLIRTSHNDSELTEFGKEFLASSPQEQDDLLLQAVLSSRLFQRLILFFEMHPYGVTRSELEEYMIRVTEPVGQSMMSRRVSTVISWLKALNVLRQYGERYILGRGVFKKVRMLEFQDIAEPLLPRTADLRDYKIVGERAQKAKSAIRYMRDAAAIERANDAHQGLVDLVASRLRAADCVPRYNQLIDLAARVENHPFIFEMKSTTEGNTRSQIRRGMSQLYEYRYLQGLLEATLVLVVETPLPKEIGWMQQYLEGDREIRLLWDGDDELYTSSDTRNELAFLWMD